jgi:hypothetical protein
LKKAGVFILFCFLSLFAYGESYFIDSEEVRILRRLYSSAGLVFPMNAYPVNGSDLLKATEKLPAPTREKDRKAWDALIEKFQKQRDAGIMLKGKLAAAYEHRFRSSSVLADPDEVKNGIDFQRAYFSFDPILSLGAGGGTFTGVNAEAEVQLRQPWKYNYAPVNNFLYPFQEDEIDINFNVLSKGMLSWNGTHLDIGIGRDKVHFGSVLGGSLYPSLSLPFMDAVRISVPLGRFSMDYMLATIEPRKGREEQDVVLGNNFGFMFDANPSTILTATHVFHWNFGRIKVGVGGTVVYARSNNMFLITDILPVTIYHNSDIRPNNLNFNLDFSWAFYPGFTLSFTFGFDDINAKSVGIGDTSIPTIPAGILQFEYALSTAPFTADFLFEAGYTHYLWGNYAYDGGPDDGDTWRGVYLEKAIYRYSTFDYGALLPLTSPYGPGTTWGRLRGDFYLDALPLKLSAVILVLSKLRGANLVTTDYKEDSAIEDGPRFWYFSLDLPCVYTFKHFDFKFSPALLVRDGNAAFELTLGARFNLTGGKHL